MMREEDISDAIARGDRQAVKAWLNAEDSDVNSFGVDGLPGHKKWVRRPHMKILGLRSLYARGRALARAPRRRLRCYGAARQDHAIEFLVKLGDNGIVWNILSFWKETN